MKSNDQKNELTANNDDSLLEGFLSRELKHSSDYIDDQGFAALVMQKLPKQRRLPKWLEWSILIVPSLLVAVIVLMQMDLSNSLVISLAVLKSLSFMQLILLSGGASLLFLIGVVWWVTQEKN